MKNGASMHRGDALWQDIQTMGIQGYAQGTWIHDTRTLSNLTEALGIGAHDGLNCMMRLSGVDEAYITGKASDYDKLVALLGVLPLWLGHPYAEAILRLVEMLSGVAPTADNAALIWRMSAEYFAEHNVTYQGILYDWGIRKITVMMKPEDLAECSREGEAQVAEGCLCLPSLTSADLWSSVSDESSGEIADMAGILHDQLDAAARGGCCCVAVDLGGVGSFSRPNPYTPAKAVRKLQKGELLSPEEERLVAAQAMRLLGQECLRRQWPLTVLNPIAECWLPLCAYLADSDCLPCVTVISERPYETVLSGMGARLNMDGAVSEDVREQMIGLTAAQMPLGCLNGLYVPLQGIVDAGSMLASCRALCRAVAHMAETCGELWPLDTQMAMLRRILC